MAAWCVAFIVAVAGAAQTVPVTAASLRSAYDRGEYAAVAAAIRSARDLPRLLREIENSDQSRRAITRQDLLFGLETGGAALVAGDARSREAAARLLAFFQSRLVEEPAVTEFECAWHLAAVAVLEARGAATTDRALDRGLERCPAYARLLLARARRLDRAWTFGAGAVAGMPPDGRYVSPAARARATAASDEVHAAERAYAAAILHPETQAEGRIRLAWLLFRAGDAVRARRELEDADPGPVDRSMRFLRLLFLGHVLASAEEWDAADATLRRALDEAPGVQSARVLLMAVQLGRGEMDAAVSLAGQIESEPLAAVDPWWIYQGGDIRLYGQIVERLREAGR
jgi:hypothetical protein